MKKKTIKKLLSIVLVGLIVCSTLFSALSASAAQPETLNITGVSDISWSFSDGGTPFTVRRQSHKTSDGRTAYCIQPRVTASPGVGSTQTYTYSKIIDNYDLTQTSERTAPSATFIRSVLYWADKYCGVQNLTDAGFMGVQLAIHKYPVSGWARATTRVPFTKNISVNPIAEINTNASTGAYSLQSVAISFAEALTWLAETYPVTNTSASVSLTRTGGGYISGNNYIVATYSASGTYDSITFTSSGSGIYQSVSGNNVTLYYPLNVVPATYSCSVTASVSKSNYEAYVYSRSGMQDMVVGGSSTSTATVSSNTETHDGSGNIYMYKQDAITGSKLSGATFKITNQNSGQVYWKQTDGNGYASLTGIPYGLYTVEETNAPNGYYIGKDSAGNVNRWTDVSITASKPSITLTAYNLKQSGTVTITKLDAETGSVAQGEATLNNGVYEIWDNDKCLQTLTMYNSNSVTSSNLPLGHYWVREIQAPTGYVLDSSWKEFDISAGSQDILYTTTSTTLYNNVIKGTISITKTGEEKNKEEGTDINLNDTEFSIYNSNGTLVDTITTNESGYAISKQLPYGTYTVKETKTPEGYKTSDDFTVSINENNKDYHYDIKNEVYKSKIKVVKKDKTTNQIITMSETTFKIIDKNGNIVKINGQNTFSTVNGEIILSKALTYGEYSLVEVEAPNGYLLDATPISFTVNKDSGSIIALEKKDTPLMGIVTIEKTGDTFTEIKVVPTEYGDSYVPFFSETGLQAVEFEIVANEDIITDDGTVRYNKGDIVDTVITGMDGLATSKNLYLGKYIIQESKSLNGYKLDENEYEIEVTNDGTSEMSGSKYSYVNDKSKTSITLVKNAEKWVSKTDKNTVTREVKILPGEGFTFGLYAAEDIYVDWYTAYGEAVPDDENDMNEDVSDEDNVDEEVLYFIPQDSLIAIATTDENGKLVFDIEVPFAKYYIKELSAPEIHFNLINKKIEIDLTTEKIDGSLVEVNIDEPIVNDFDKFEVTITKKDLATGDTVAGALIEISDENGNIIYRDYTGEDGIVPNVVLEPGKYTFKEVIAPNGYALNTSVFEFEVTENGDIIGNTIIEDEYTKYKIIKTDENGNPLKDVAFGLFDENGNKITEVITDENGVAEFVGFKEGKYTIKETKAPQGYYENNDIIAEIVNDGKYVNSETDNVSKVINKKIVESPKTGYNTSIFGFFVLGFVTSISVCFFVARHQDKKRKNNLKK